MSSSTSKKTTAAPKVTATKVTATKAKAPIKKVPSPAQVPAAPTQTAPGLSGPVLKKQELIEKVVQASGIKKKDAKPVVEAMLEVLGEALADGRELNLQPMGKVKLNRTKETPGARIIIAKIRQSKGVNTGQNDAGFKDGAGPVAAAAE
ncbi:MAG: HU family DNA-binding protein [Roseovarius sp.]